MATTPTRHRFNRTMALAVAAGVALTGGVQIAHDSNTAQAENVIMNAVDNREDVAYTHAGEVNQTFIRKDSTKGVTNIVMPLSGKGPAVAEFPKETFKAAGFSPDLPFTVIHNSDVSNEVEFIDEKGISHQIPTGKRGSETSYDGNEGFQKLVVKNLNYRTDNAYNGTAYPIRIEQNGKIFNFVPTFYNATFMKPRSFVIPVGETVRVDKPFNSVAAVRNNGLNEGAGDHIWNIEPTFKLDSALVPGLTVNDDGSFEFTPTESQKGKEVTIRIRATLTGNDTYTQPLKDENVQDQGLYADATYIFTVPNDAASITDNGDGTFTFNDGTAGAEDVTINTKDGVQDVTKQGNTLTFKMADGSTKKINVAANITLKQNSNGTATISDGNTTLTVATANTYIEKVEKNSKGDYVLTRNDGETLTINLQDIRNDINALKEKDSPSREEFTAVENSVDSLLNQFNEFTGQNSESLKEIAERINTLDIKINTGVKSLIREINGIDTELQDLTFRVERTENRLIKEVRNNGDGTFTLVTEKYGDIPGVIDASSGVTNIISNSDGTITLEFAGKEPRTIDLHKVEVSETNKGKPNHTITIKVPGEEPFRFNAFDTYVTNIDTDGKGKYTLTLNNGETVTGVIDTSKTIKTIENRPDGSIVLVRTDGTKSDPIKLEQVKIVHANKGTPEHTVTIKVPGGETVTLDAYDNFVTSVAKKSNGIYEIKRNDGKSWTINITDLYKRVANLEAKDSPTRDEFNAVKNDIAEYKKLVDTRFTKVEGDVAALRADLTAVEKRVTVLEARVDRIDNVLGDLAKCNSAKQVASIPAALSIALYALSQAHLPGVEAMNTQIQKQIGIYNANAAKMWSQYGGVLQAAAATTVVAGMIGTLAYALNECQDYNRTDEMKNTPAGKLTAQADARKAEREARTQARDKARTGTKQDA